MSKYTTELRFICEEKAGLFESQDDSKTDEIISKSVGKIFNFNYPLFEESYRDTLNKKIINHFYFREIGYETYALWHNRLRMKMNEIMPYYNKLYESETLQYDPFRNYDITKIHDGEFNTDTELNRTGKDTDKYLGTDTERHTGTDQRAINTLNSHGDKWTLFSDTPQGGLDGIENATDDVADNAYLTNATREITDFTDGKTDNLTHGEQIANERNTRVEKEKGTKDTGNENGTDSYNDHYYGYRDIDPNKMLREWRENLLNIDMMIIDELESLFLKLW